MKDVDLPKFLYIRFVPIVTQRVMTVGNPYFSIRYIAPFVGHN